MDKELLLLRKLYTNPELTQRNMAKATGISLGCINALIRDFVKKEIISVEKFEKSTMVYNLTSVGIEQKSELMYKSIEEAYAFLKELSISIDNLIKEFENNTSMLVLFGNRDVLYELIVEKLLKKDIKFSHIDNLDEIRLFCSKQDALILVWEPEIINIIKNIDFRYVDLLEKV